MSNQQICMAQETDVFSPESREKMHPMPWWVPPGETNGHPGKPAHCLWNEHPRFSQLRVFWASSDTAKVQERTVFLILLCLANLFMHYLSVCTSSNKDRLSPLHPEGTCLTVYYILGIFFPRSSILTHNASQSSTFSFSSSFSALDYWMSSSNRFWFIFRKNSITVSIKQYIFLFQCVFKL